MSCKKLDTVLFGAWNTYAISMMSVLEDCGMWNKDFTFQKFLGVTGIASRFCMDNRCSALPITDYDWLKDNPLFMKRIGVTTDVFFAKATDADFKQKQNIVIEQIKQSINNNRAVTVWGVDTGEFGIIYGYDDEDGVFFTKGIGTNNTDYSMPVLYNNLRDTDIPLIDIALEYGFSSQQALTRAFTDAYGCAPSAYRRNPIPLPLTMKKTVITPSNYIKGDNIMSNLAVPSYRIEFIPAHRFLGVYERTETKNGPIWPAHDCDLMTGIVQSMKDCHPIVTNHAAGWKWVDGERKYFYGLGVDVDYNGPVPDGFVLTDVIPESYYIVFNHPPFEYLSENGEVMKRVEDLAWNFDPKTIGYEWNETECQDYQRHYPEVIGYQILRPIKKTK